MFDVPGCAAVRLVTNATNDTTRVSGGERMCPPVSGTLCQCPGVQGAPKRVLERRVTPDNGRAMRLTSLPLAPGNIQRCRELWGDRSLYSQAELEGVIGDATTLLAEGRARGALLVDEAQRPRFFGLTAFVRERAVADLIADPRPRIGARFLSDRQAAVLDESAIARGNGAGGLHLVVLNQGYDMPDTDGGGWGTLFGALLKDFHDVHRGFRLASMMGEAFGHQGVQIVTTSLVYPKSGRSRSRSPVAGGCRRCCSG